MNSPETRKAAVFGANGSIGTELTGQLSERGIDTLAIVRPGKEHEIAALPHVTPVKVDFANFDELSATLKGVTEVYCTIANFNQGIARQTLSFPKPFPPDFGRRALGTGTAFEEAYRTNVILPERIHTASERQGVEHMVYLSSIAVYGRSTGEVTEDTPCNAHGIYGVTKYLAEERLLDYHENTKITILRPANVFGPGAETWTERLYQRFMKHEPFVLGNGEGKMHPVDIRDVSAAMIKAVENPQADGEVYNLAADKNLSQAEIAAYYKLVTGKDPIVLPAISARAGTLVLDAYSIITGRKVPFLPDTVTYESVENLLDPTRTISNEKAKELGAAFRPVEETMRDSLLWLNERHGLKKEGVIFEAFEQKK